MEPYLKAHEAFTPTQPRSNRTMLTGRLAELETIVQGLVEDKAHVILYSERGRGKTSLANVIIEALRRNGLIVVRYQCEASTTFDSCIRGLARDLPASLLTAPARQDAMEGCEAALPATPVRPADVLGLLPRLRLWTLVCVIDEFDRVTDVQTRTMFADALKQLSDRGVALRFLIIGVSENLEQLVGQHPSIQRNLVAVPLPLMSNEDIATVLAKGSGKAGLTFAPGVVDSIVTVARGLPYVAQLLGLRVAQLATKRGRQEIVPGDLADAAARLIRETPPGVQRRYDELTSDGTDRRLSDALVQAASGRQDKWGEMLVSEVGDTVTVGGQQVSAAAWMELCERGVVRAHSERSKRYSFSEPALAQYVLLTALVSYSSLPASDMVRDAGPAAGDRLEPSLPDQTSHP